MNALWLIALAIVAVPLLAGLPALFLTYKVLGIPDLAACLTAWATLFTAWATIALVRTTAQSLKEQSDRLKEQSDRAKIAHSTELFLQLRERAISPERVALRRRVIALLGHLEERELSPENLEFSPDINLYLNNLQWIGRLVNDDILKVDYARATYGRDLLLLYPKLEKYIEKEQGRRDYPTLWGAVRELYD